jgi:hypothetical protein
MNDAHISIADSRHPQWNRGHINSRIGKERWVYLGMAVVWNAIAQPVFWLNVLNQPDLALGPLLLVALFPLVGAGLGYAAIIKWLQWRRFGNLELVMDPFPGSLGGEVGGVVEIPLVYRSGKTVDVTLSCVNVRITRGHKNNTRHEDVVWRERAEVSVEPGLHGSRIRFLFQLPAGQPATSEPSDNCIKWVVHLNRKLPGADLDQTFEVPVLDTGTPLQSRHIRQPSVRTSDAGDLPVGNVVMKPSADGLHVFYPASRGRGMGLAMLMFGSLFGVVPWFIATEFSSYSGSGFGMIFIAFGGFFVLVFGLIGLFLVSFGIYSLFNSLDVRVSGQGIVSTRHFWGLKFRRALQRTEIVQLRFKINAQQGQGAKSRVHYLLEAVPASGRPVCLGDGIQGKPLAGRLMQELGRFLGHDEWREVSRLKKRIRS